MSDSRDDFDLCNDTFKRIAAVHGDPSDVSEIRVEHRTVLLVWHVFGIINNGGFRYLLSGNLPGDPTLEHTAAAFEALNVPDAVWAFRRLFQMFPGGVPARTVESRLKWYFDGSGHTRGELDDRFFRSGNEVRASLSTYIRRHHEAFEGLPEPPEDEFLDNEDDQTEADGPFDDPSSAGYLLHQLPPDIRIALASQAAAIALEHLGSVWPNINPGRLEAIQAAVRLSRHAADTGTTPEGIVAAGITCTCAAGVLAMSAVRSIEEINEPVPANARDALIASQIAKTLRCAVDSATSTDEIARTTATLESLSYAEDALSHANSDVQMLWDAILWLHGATEDGPVESLRPTELVAVAIEDCIRYRTPWWKFWIRFRRTPRKIGH